MAFHRPQMIFLTKTKVAGQRAYDIFSRLGFDKFIKSDSEDLSGGIAILWQNSLQVSLISSNSQELHIKIHVNPSSLSFAFSTIYSRPYKDDFTQLWHNLQVFSKFFTTPLLVGGDFNQIYEPNKTKKGQTCESLCIDSFNSFIDACNLFDLGFTGPMFTWNQLIQERLDKFLMNQHWLDIFPNAHVFHLTRFHSDHCPCSSTPSLPIPHLGVLNQSLCGLITLDFLNSFPKLGFLIETIFLAYNLSNMKPTFGID